MMRTKTLINGALVCLLAVASGSLPSAHAVAASAAATGWFLERTQALYDAVAVGDKTIWRQTLSDDCIITDEDGEVYDKTAFLDTLTGLPKGFSGVIRVRRLTARIFGAAASVHLLDRRARGRSRPEAPHHIRGNRLVSPHG